LRRYDVAKSACACTGADFSSRPTTGETAALAIETRLEWRSEQAAHVDRLLVNLPALQADGRWRAAGEEVLRGGEVAFDAAPWCQPCGQANIALQRTGSRLPADLAVGRHYPRGMFGRALGSPRDMRPLRLVADAGDGTLLLDPNHPLAAAQARMNLHPASVPAAPALRLEELFAGPGMQRLPSRISPPEPSIAPTPPATSPSTPGRALRNTSTPVAGPSLRPSMVACCNPACACST